MLVDLWQIATTVLAACAAGTFLHLFISLFRRVQLHPGGSGFEKAVHFKEPSRERLQQHYDRFMGTLVFWKSKAALFERLHVYSVTWSVSASILVAALVQEYDPANLWAKAFMTILTLTSGLLLGISKAFRAEENYRAYRTAESEFFDLRRRIMDRPEAFGPDEVTQLSKYFEEAERIRKTSRLAELNNPPNTPI
ncbi:hypothetical protein [Hyalangium minutum]|uniref:hypothetical protein n=1 Tax=Hyalangium minutum TaxID=394096 RepID=UPI0012FBFEC6|nr:hypothetical protein [Hyalangium minutum]